MFSAPLSNGRRPRLDQFNIKHCFIVVGVFGVITIISYFNELAKHGLLQKTVHLYPKASRKLEETGEHDSKIGIDLKELKGSLKRNVRSANQKFHDYQSDKINLALYLDKNISYESSKADSNVVKIVTYKNVLPNFFSQLQAAINLNGSDSWLKNISNASKSGQCSLLNVSDWLSKIEFKITTTISLANASFLINGASKNDSLCQKQSQLHLQRFWNKSIALQKDLKQKYLPAVKVFVYQSDIKSYSMRSCFKKVSSEAGLNIFSAPLNHVFRPEWEKVDKRKREQFNALHGSLSFGVCENTNRPCMYLSMVIHPLDRILQLYFQCVQSTIKLSKKNKLCQYYKASNASDIYGFIKATGNVFFKKLIYYTKHCKLIGNDEICIKDMDKASFILKPNEKQMYLENVLANLENWFAVVGVVESFNESLQMFQYVTGLNFSGCPIVPYSLVPKRYQNMHINDSEENISALNNDLLQLKEKLLNDTQVLKWLHADLAIYDKIKSIFLNQWKFFLTIQEYSKVLWSSNTRRKRSTAQRISFSAFNIVDAQMQTNTTLPILSLKSDQPIQTELTTKSNYSNSHFKRKAKPYLIKKLLKETAKRQVIKKKYHRKVLLGVDSKKSGKNRGKIR